MGVVKKQGIANSVWIYIGLALGYLNMAVLMAKFLSTENLGARQVLFQAGDFFSVIALVGLRNIINRFFPSYDNKEKKHNGFLVFILGYWLIGTIISSLILIVCKDFVLSYYEEKSNILNGLYFVIIPFGASMALFQALAAYSTSLLKSTMPIFIREVGQRIFTSLLLALVIFEIINFETFMVWYLVSYVIALFVLIFYLVKLGQFKIYFSKQYEWVSKIKEMTVFGLFTWFNNAMQILVKTADVLMLGAASGLASAGIYGIGALVGNIVQVPSQSLRQIGAPLISRYFKENNLNEVGNLYRKTCMIQLIAGLFIYLLILVNMDALFTIWRKEFEVGKTVIIYLGLARLVSGSTGLNGRIIVESKYFRWNFYFNLILGILVVTSNYILIPKYGILGASLASALSIVSTSMLKVLFVYIKFGLQPFSSKSILAILIGLGAFGAAYFVPLTNIFVADILLKTSIFCVIFIPLVIRSKLSTDANEMVYNGVKKIRKILS
ncbi:MAG: polysaccharide biosynthesis C-terminal domain-containing protein [Bacteroidia bacterium]